MSKRKRNDLTFEYLLPSKFNTDQFVQSEYQNLIDGQDYSLPRPKMKQIVEYKKNSPNKNVSFYDTLIDWIQKGVKCGFVTDYIFIIKSDAKISNSDYYGRFKHRCKKHFIQTFDFKVQKIVFCLCFGTYLGTDNLPILNKHTRKWTLKSILGKQSQRLFKSDDAIKKNIMNEDQINEFTEQCKDISKLLIDKWDGLIIKDAIEIVISNL